MNTRTDRARTFRARTDIPSDVPQEDVVEYLAVLFDSRTDYLIYPNADVDRLRADADEFIRCARAIAELTAGVLTVRRRPNIEAWVLPSLMRAITFLFMMGDGAARAAEAFRAADEDQAAAEDQAAEVSHG